MSASRRRAKAQARTACMYVFEESDRGVIPTNHSSCRRSFASGISEVSRFSSMVSRRAWGLRLRRTERELAFALLGCLPWNTDADGRSCGSLRGAISDGRPLPRSTSIPKLATRRCDGSCVFRLQWLALDSSEGVMSGAQLKYVIKFVADMDNAVKFYQDTLGLPLRFQSPGWSEFVTGETSLALHPASD